MTDREHTHHLVCEKVKDALSESLRDLVKDGNSVDWWDDLFLVAVSNRLKRLIKKETLNRYMRESKQQVRDKREVS